LSLQAEYEKMTLEERLKIDLRSLGDAARDPNPRVL
jgi:hypothetical protein